MILFTRNLENANKSAGTESRAAAAAGFGRVAPKGALDASGGGGGDCCPGGGDAFAGVCLGQS